MDRYESAAAVLDDLPNLAKKAGAKAGIAAPPKGEIERELEATAKLGAFHPRLLRARLFRLPRRDRLAARRSSPCAAGRTCSTAPPSPLSARETPPLWGAAWRETLRETSLHAGYVIVSGMARGVDGEAHAASLDTGTIAAIAGGIDQIYPPQHDRLYEELCQRGTLVSESPLGYVAQARDFPKRNRIISGLSLATIIVEAAERSGSLITARMALEQGREVMAVPGSPLDPRAKGANRLIKQGAALIESADDVLNAMQGVSPPSFEEPFADRYDAQDATVPPALLRAVREALSPTPTHINEIVRAVDAPHRLVLAAIAELELSGVAQTHVGELPHWLSSASCKFSPPTGRVSRSHSRELTFGVATPSFRPNNSPQSLNL
jgi:DNA processing protein